MKTIRFIDLFAGIGGFRYGLENCRRSKPFRKGSGSKGDKFNSSRKKNKYSSPYACVYSNEYNKYASQIYKKHYEECDTRNIRTVKANKIPNHDLLCAGFPCQSFSIAGKRLGFEDTRGTLFFEIARIAKHKRPRYLLLENVKGLLSHEEGKTFQTIIGVLSDLGYRVEWQVLNSKHFGVPQNRERVFIIGCLREECGQKVFPIGEDDKILNKEQQQPIQGKVQASKQKNSSHTNKKNAQNGEDRQLHYLGGVEGKRKKWLKDGKDKSRNFSQGQRVYGTKGIASTLAGNAGGQGGKTGLYAVRQPLRYLNRNQKNIKGDYAFTVDGSNTSGIKQGIKIRRLTPKECERLQGFPDGWTEGISDTQRYRCLGNAVTTNVIESIGKKLWHMV